jgi:hypothetical protein
VLTHVTSSMAMMNTDRHRRVVHVPWRDRRSRREVASDCNEYQVDQAEDIERYAQAAE